MEHGRVTDDSSSSVVSKHGRLTLEVHRFVHFSHCYVKIHLIEREGGGERGEEEEEREREREEEEEEEKEADKPTPNRHNIHHLLCFGR